jgi:hypothetical protein
VIGLRNLVAHIRTIVDERLDELDRVAASLLADAGGP